jgi:hypothetical protein
MWWAYGVRRRPPGDNGQSAVVSTTSEKSLEKALIGLLYSPFKICIVLSTDIIIYLKGGEMRNSPMCFLKKSKSYSILFSFILILPAVAFCASWEAIGPEGGNFIFSVTNPVDANEVTAITTSPSPSNVYRSTGGE